MLPERRRIEILELIRSHGEVKIQALARHFAVSPMTVRRDLEALQAQGRLHRTYGGAVAAREPEPSLHDKKVRHHAQKEQIAEKALAYVRPNMSVLVDAGSTTWALARRLAAKAPLTVITPDLTIARDLSDTPGLEVFVTGGQVKAGVYRLEGEYALQFFNQVAADVAFLGCDGFTEAYAFSHTVAQAALKRAMIAQAASSVLLADASKYRRPALHKVAALTDFDAVIVDHGLPSDAQHRLREAAILLDVAQG